MENYESVIGLEVHAQLLTNSKAFSADSTEYGCSPNTNISAITLGHPGTLPVINRQVFDHAIRLGLACGCTIRHENQFARKNYFYADLPKGYQITQHTTPICTGGGVNIKLAGGGIKKISLTRIHIEEDAGKSIHDQDPFFSLIDLNRAGVPLLEIVSEPEIRSGEEAYAYLTEVRKLVRYLELCDGNMEEGSLRCDANISVRLKGETALGIKVEVKNMNSIRNVQRAIEYEIARQVDTIKNGGKLVQETRSFDASNGTTFSLREKEMANDYRYFPEPDLLPVLITEEHIATVKKDLPPLPDELFRKYTNEFGLSDQDASVLTDDKETALYFEKITSLTHDYKSAANWMMGPVKSYLNEKGIVIGDFPLKPIQICELIKLVDEGKVSHSMAVQRIYPALLTDPGKNSLHIAQEQNLLQEKNVDALQQWVKEAIAKYPGKVKEYKAGKTGLTGLFMGEVMKLSKGKADPKLANEMVKKMLDSD